MSRNQTTIGITLLLMLVMSLGRAEAKQRRFKGHVAGTSVDGTIDTNGDGIAADVAVEVANTNLGRFINQGGTEVKNPNAPNPPSACQLPDGTVGFEFGLVQGHGVSTHERTGDQLFADETSFTECVNFLTGKFSFSAAGTWAGGTGQFANARGLGAYKGAGHSSWLIRMTTFSCNSRMTSRERLSPQETNPHQRAELVLCAL